MTTCSPLIGWCRSVSRVFIGGVCIGGGDETVAADRAGKLRGMLEAAGAL